MARIVTALLFVALALPSAAGAHLRTIAPPGDSSASEYVESVPSDNGNRPTSSLGSHPGALTPSQSQTLDHAGANGRTLVAVVNATSPPSAGRTAGAHGARSGAGASSTAGAIAGQAARSPVSSVLAAAAGSGGGMGLALPVILGAAVLGAFLLLFLRRRGASPPPPPPS